MLTWGAFTFWMKVFALAQMTDCWCLIGCCWNCTAALIGLRPGQTIFCLEFHSKFHAKNLAQCHHYKCVGRHERFLVWVESQAATSHNPPDLDPSSQSHSSHLPHGASQRRRLELKSIKLQYISRPYKAACTDTRARKNSSNINQVIENLCGWFEASWFITPSQISLRLRGCSPQRRREYQFPGWFLAVFRIWSLHNIGCNLHQHYLQQPKFRCENIDSSSKKMDKMWNWCDVIELKLFLTPPVALFKFFQAKFMYLMRLFPSKYW